MNEKIRVLVVDDSDFVRAFIRELLSEDPEILVIGEAANGKEACEKVAALKPDIVTMDIEMPVMDGIEAIEQIMSFYAVPILVVTSKSDANTAYEAISKGALEVLRKPDFDSADSNELIRKIRLLSKVKVIRHIAAGHIPRMGAGSQDGFLKADGADRIVAIASSTGGPKALLTILSGLPECFPLPIIVAQHIPDEFISGMAEWLDKSVALKVKPGKHGERVKPGTVYLALSEKHMKIEHGNRITFQDRELKDIYFPSCNLLLSSAAKVYKKHCIGVILTGMGNDGVNGMKEIKKAEGITIAQDEETSVIFGMPRAAIESGCIDYVLPIGKIAEKIVSLSADIGKK